MVGYLCLFSIELVGWSVGFLVSRFISFWSVCRLVIWLAGCLVLLLLSFPLVDCSWMIIGGVGSSAQHVIFLFRLPSAFLFVVTTNRGENRLEILHRRVTGEKTFTCKKHNGHQARRLRYATRREYHRMVTSAVNCHRREQQSFLMPPILRWKATFVTLEESFQSGEEWLHSFLLSLVI